MKPNRRVHIGLDFDNTLIDYDGVFHQVALEKGLIDEHVPVSKMAVRDSLRERDQEDDWTELQGYVYGMRLSDAAPYQGVLDFLKKARAENMTVSIVSHKTRHPYRGPRYDLHAAARKWIENGLCDNEGALVPMERVYFHETKPEKINRIGSEKCDVFVDDLPEILTASGFPESTRAILFDPSFHHRDMTSSGLTLMHHWRDFDTVLAEL